MQLTIGCCGRARHGKGTLAKFIQQWHDDKSLACQVIAFADPLKDFLTLLVGRKEPFRGTGKERDAPIPELTWGDLEKPMIKAIRKVWPGLDLKANPTGRALMQVFGTECIRKMFLADAWLRMAENRAMAFAGTTVVDDVRFPNETTLKTEWQDQSERWGIFNYIFKVTRKGVEKLDHPSENCVDEIDPRVFEGVLTNDGPEDDLRKVITAWLDFRWHTDVSWRITLGGASQAC